MLSQKAAPSAAVSELSELAQPASPSEIGHSPASDERLAPQPGLSASHASALAQPDSAQEPHATGPSDDACPGQQQQQRQQKQKQQQQHQDDVAGPVDTHAHADSAGREHTQQQRDAVIDGALQQQGSSSMTSLSPSLKLDIPGLDHILSSDLLSANDDQATSELQLHQGSATQHSPQAAHNWQHLPVDQPEVLHNSQHGMEVRSDHPAGPEAVGHAIGSHPALRQSPRTSSQSASKATHAGASGDAGGPASQVTPNASQLESHSKASPAQCKSAARPTLTEGTVPAQQQAVHANAHHGVSEGSHGQLPALSAGKIAQAEQPELGESNPPTPLKSSTPHTDAGNSLLLVDKTPAQPYSQATAAHDTKAGPSPDADCSHQHESSAAQASAEVQASGASASEQAPAASQQLPADSEQFPAASEQAKVASEQAAAASDSKTSCKGTDQRREDECMADGCAISSQQAAASGSQKVHVHLR